MAKSYSENLKELKKAVESLYRINFSIDQRLDEMSRDLEDIKHLLSESLEGKRKSEELEQALFGKRKGGRRP